MRFSSRFVCFLINAMQSKFPGEQELEKRTFNIIFSKGEDGGLKIYFIPRRKETPSNFTNAFAFCEMGGLLINETTKDFKNVNEDNIRRALSECGYSYEDDKIIRDILASTVLRMQQRNDEIVPNSTLQMSL